MMEPNILREARLGHRGLVRFALACVPCAVAAVLLGVFDERVITGAPAWNKPLKFFLSGGLYAATFAWYLRQWQTAAGRVLTRPLQWAATGVWVALAIELGLIALQAGRGVTSHFNFATPFDARVFNVMGVMIAVLSVCHVVLWLALLRLKAGASPALAACRWGAGVTLLGLVVGAMMVAPTPDQIAHRDGGRLAIAGAHTVGAPDGGPGLPFVNWSTGAGDRRPSHFAGLHAMQVVPAVLWLVPAWPPRARLAAVRATGVAWALVTLILIAQASAGRSVASLGVWTLALALTCLGWAAALWAGRRSAAALVGDGRATTGA